VFRIVTSLLSLTGASLLIGCASPHRAPASAGLDLRAGGSPSGAQARAMARAEADADRARQLLESAIARDPFDGPTFNNLGALHFAAGRMRDAALAFAEARRLMPGAPEPRANLAMALEQAGLFDEAAEAYAAALECNPRHWPAILGLARLEGLTRSGSAEHIARLDLIAREAPDPAWRAWASGAAHQEPTRP
jgi:tetratricopeptide (TPR) repeat protein